MRVAFAVSSGVGADDVFHAVFIGWDTANARLVNASVTDASTGVAKEMKATATQSYLFGNGSLQITPLASAPLLVSAGSRFVFWLANVTARGWEGVCVCMCVCVCVCLYVPALHSSSAPAQLSSCSSACGETYEENDPVCCYKRVLM